MVKRSKLSFFLFFFLEVLYATSLRFAGFFAEGFLSIDFLIALAICDFAVSSPVSREADGDAPNKASIAALPAVVRAVFFKSVASCDFAAALAPCTATLPTLVATGISFAIHLPRMPPNPLPEKNMRSLCNFVLTQKIS